ncbi:MAG: GntR family transcriptional regulator [Erysipelotrichaceae bacterium]|nr:GntR family transcriptional regulator [Erysipelotrichaceae bacterium]
MFLINFQKNEPIFMQIIKQVIKFYEIGVLKEGDKLPSVRHLAVELGVNPNTVAKAYQELENLQIVETLNKKGVFIKKINDNSVNKSLIKNLEILLCECKDSNISKKQIIDLIENIWRD